MKNLEEREGFINRHTNGLPKEKCVMRVVVKDVDREYIHLCQWEPFDKSKHTKNNMPSEGYLGTVKVIEGKYTGIGFHAWEQNNSEFVFYTVV
jgi:hypothetical protein